MNKEIYQEGLRLAKLAGAFRGVSQVVHENAGHIGTFENCREDFCVQANKLFWDSIDSIKPETVVV